MRELPVKVSVIVPVYNVEKYLSACLNSCVNQTLNDTEFICVNDGSTDNSLHILEEFAAVDHRIKIINKSNGGLSSARNAGLREACGEFVMFLDADDYLAPMACERVWCETLEAPTDIIIFGTSIFPDLPRASNWYYEVLSVRTHRYTKFTPKVLFGEPSSKPFVWRQAFRRQLLAEHELEFDECIKYGEDIVFQMKIFPHGTNFSFIADKLYCYRWYREGSLMQSFRFDLDQKISQHLKLADWISIYWQDQGWLKQYGVEYTQWMLEFLVPDIRSKDVKCASEHLEKLKNILVNYSLEKYLDKVPASVKGLAATVKRGSV